MKYKMHNQSSRAGRNEIFCDILDDDDNLLFGNYIHQTVDIVLPSSIEGFFSDTIFPIVEQMLEQDQPGTKEIIEASVTLQNIEKSKEQIKWDAIGFIKANPSSTIDDLQAFIETNHGWQNAGLVMTLIHEYAIQAEAKNLVTITDHSKNGIYTLMKALAASNTIEQIKELLDG